MNTEWSQIQKSFVYFFVFLSLHTSETTVNSQKNTYKIP